MKFNLAEKVFFGLLLLGFLYLVSPFRENPITSVFFAFIWAIPLLGIAGFYILFKAAFFSDNNAKPQSAQQKREKSYEKAYESRYYKPVIVTEEANERTVPYVIAVCGYSLMGLLFVDVVFYVLMKNLFLIGIIFVPMLFAFGLASLGAAALPLGFFVIKTFKESNRVQPSVQQEQSFSTFETFGIICYVIGIVGLVICVNILFS